MGTDIHGIVECRWDHWPTGDETAWDAAISLDHLYDGRSYAAFGALFGVRDDTSFRPLADHRGLPPDAAAGTVAAYHGWGRDAHGASWITWAELATTDWSEPATAVDACVHEYRRGPDGAWHFHGRNTSLTRFAGLARIDDPTVLYRAGRTHPEGTEWPDGDRLFRIARLRRGDAVPEADWGAVWSVMRTLADRHGPDGVRLVVWFDC
ncbi:hypothetical protein [Streptomyces sp. NPDC090022]|uniref:hypothetical protein n=1 Tax=Streptomyces sp. NPDC090022 TaxID=3365920 RepID=UPI00380A78F0